MFGTCLQAVLLPLWDVARYLGDLVAVTMACSKLQGRKPRALGRYVTVERGSRCIVKSLAAKVSIPP